MIGGDILAGNELTNIQVYRKKWNMNIGIILFIFIFIYLVVTVLLYFTGKHVSVYEVREGSILKDNAYTGFILRDEVVVNAETEGYVNYFALEGTKVGAKTNVYTTSPKKLDFDKDSAEETTALTSDEQATLLLKSQSFGENFNSSHFSDVYSLRNSISTIMENKSSKSRHSQLDTMISSGVEGVQIHTAARDGIVIYSADGYEGTQLSDITEKMLSKTNYKQQEFVNNEKVAAGSPVYKLITNDKWTLVISLDDKMAQSMANTKSVKVRFAKDSETAVADFSIYNTKDSNLGFLTFSSSMIRYAEERYLDIELILEDQSGLKIPKSSVVKKKFYLVPEEYLTQGGNSNETGVLVMKSNNNAQFEKVDVYYRDNESGMVYLDTESFKSDTVLTKPESVETLKVNETKTLRGVYNINKGYAVFKQINILSESEEYYIVQSGNNYGLANYDHIALDGTTVRDNDVIF